MKKQYVYLYVCFLKIFYLFTYLFLDRGEGREKEREKNIHVWLPLAHPTLGNLACNPRMCPNWELNQQPFGPQASAQYTETYQPGRMCVRFKFLVREGNLKCLRNIEALQKNSFIAYIKSKINAARYVVFHYIGYKFSTVNYPSKTINHIFFLSSFMSIP